MKYASRKFIDLIQRATSKWANWDPPKAIQVGDYGTINKETGEFEWEGNIYNPQFQQLLQVSDTSDRGLDLVAASGPPPPPPVQEDGDEHLIIQSSSVSAKLVNIGAEAHLPPPITSSAAFKVELQFRNDTRGAVLIIYKPRYTSLPKDERMVAIVKAVPDILRGKAVVVEVVSCPAYAMYLSDKTEQSFSISLVAKAPVLPGGGVVAGGEMRFERSSDAVSGIFRYGSNIAGTFFPLYKLKMPRPSIFSFRGHGIDSWEDVEPSWFPLDEDGEEEVIDDDDT